MEKIRVDVVDMLFLVKKELLYKLYEKHFNWLLPFVYLYLLF